MAVHRAAVTITRFGNQYRFLSNFYGCTVEFEGVSYPSVEHAYQAAKSLDPRDRRKILNARTPGVARRLGRGLPLRPGWEALKQGVMLACLESKFAPGSELAERLLTTHPSPLIEGNLHGGAYWGVDLWTGEGQNILGKLLQVVREKLRKGTSGDAERRRRKVREYHRARRARIAAEFKERNADKASVPLAPLPELPWAKLKRKGQGKENG